MISRPTSLLTLLVFAVIAVSCTSSGSERGEVAPSALPIVERPEWADLFAERGVEGTFALHELGTERVLVHDPQRAATPVIPASTFKILNSLIALDTGAVADVDVVIPWDGIERPVEAWNRDHSLRTGIEVSAVWAYQDLARTIGTERMSQAVDAAEYGNTDIGGPIDRFWLDGDLRISPLDQLDFLARLIRGDLPFDADDQAAVRDILIRERDDGWVWGHKTGTALGADPVLGWLVGYTVDDEAEWVFAMNLDLTAGTSVGSQIDPQVRQTLSRSILENAGALPS